MLYYIEKQSIDNGIPSKWEREVPAIFHDYETAFYCWGLNWDLRELVVTQNYDENFRIVDENGKVY